jgi:hypothetical protein
VHVYKFYSPISTEYPIYWIEGIGSLAGLLYSSITCCGSNKILCHYDSNQIRNYYDKVLHQASPCEGYVDVPIIIDQPPIKIFPNPSSNSELFIEGKNMYKAEIINLQGQILNEIFLTDKKSNNIVLKHSPGIYFIEIYLLDGSKSIKKIIIN